MFSDDVSLYSEDVTLFSDSVSLYTEAITLYSEEVILYSDDPNFSSEEATCYTGNAGRGVLKSSGRGLTITNMCQHKVHINLAMRPRPS